MRVSGRLVFLALLVCVAPTGPAAAQSTGPANVPSWAVHGEDVSPEFRAEVEHVLAELPTHVRGRLAEAGWRVVTAEYVVNAAPHLRNQRPRGWPSGMTWESSDGVHLPDRRLLVIAEKRRTEKGPQRCRRAAQVLRHELGHAFDLLHQHDGSGIGSSQPAFRRAYDADLAVLSAEDSRRLSYYLQGGDAGRQEVFAEAFALLLGGGTNAASDDCFRRAFPRVLAFVEGRLHAVSPDP